MYPRRSMRRRCRCASWVVLSGQGRGWAAGNGRAASSKRSSAAASGVVVAQVHATVARMSRAGERRGAFVDELGVRACHGRLDPVDDAGIADAYAAQIDVPHDVRTGRARLAAGPLRYIHHPGSRLVDVSRSPHRYSAAASRLNAAPLSPRL